MSSLRLILPALVLLAGCGKSVTPESTAVVALPAVKVGVATAQAAERRAVIEVTGTVRPAQRAQIAAKFMGAIQEMPVKLGQRVAAGDLLVRMSAGEITARVAQAQAQFNVARRDLERERGLLAKGASTADMVRGLEDKFTMTEAMVREAEVMLGYAEVRAPFAGVVARTLVHVGDLASPGFPLLELEGADNFQVEVGLPDSLAAQLALGATLKVEIPVTGLSFTGSLAELSSAADANNRTVSAKIAVPAGSAVRSGQFARVQVPGASVRALLVPAAALTVLGQMERVFVAGTDRLAVLRIVKSGATQGDLIEILSGLDPGERVIVNPPATLREGQPLEILP